MHGSIIGQVLSAASGQGLGQVSVELRRVSGSSAQDTPEPQHLLSDEHGWFSASHLAPGSWRLETSGSPSAHVEVLPFATCTLTLTIKAQVNQRSLPEPGSPQTGAITGQVVFAASNMPIPYASVIVLWGAGPAPDIAPMTDTAGRFILDGLSPGEWAVRAISAQGASTDVRVCVSAGQHTAVRIEIAMNADSSSGAAVYTHRK